MKQETKKQFIKQPTRILIQIVNAMPKAMIEEVSPRSMTFRNYNKIPLILTQTEAAL